MGQNNVGKSTILESLRWLLKPSARSASDFTDTEQPIVVTAKIEGISAAIPGLIPEPKHRAAIEPYCRNGILWIRVRLMARQPIHSSQKSAIQQRLRRTATSIDYGELKKMALPWFSVIQEEISVHSVWQSKVNSTKPFGNRQRRFSVQQIESDNRQFESGDRDCFVHVVGDWAVWGIGLVMA